MSRGRWLPAAAWLLAFPALAADATTELYQRIGERLELMREVGAYKWHHGLPVADEAREAVVIAAAGEDALRHQLVPATVEQVFREQIEAAKEIQRYWMDRWQQGDTPAAEPDLDGVIRPRLLALGGEIVALAARAGPFRDETAFGAAVTVDGLTPARTAALYRALTGLRRYPSRLDQILDTGVLRVGTTGDYPPFSHVRDGGDFTGADIDLAQDLAGALGASVRLVKTSWPELMADLAAGRFDIAMSGISRTLDRARHGYLSVPYHVGGKMPIARCRDQRRFDSLAAIDQPGVRVIVNPGGTNEAFVDERLEASDKIVHADNRTIFAALAAGEADVMITDSIEVKLQTRRNPELCATMAETLTYQEKAYLMPRDDALKQFIDTWLTLRLGDGTVARLIEDHLAR